MNKYIKSIIVATSLVILTGSCTDDFENYNSNPYQIHDADPATLVQSMIETTVNVQQNDSQMMDQMVGQLGGYFVCSNIFSGTNFATFNQSDAWNASTWDDSFKKIYGNFFTIEKATDGKGHYYQFARMIRAITMLRVVDTYGPMPYSQVKKGNFYTAYDTEEEVYKNILKDFSDAATDLYGYYVETGGFTPLGDNDPVYGGAYDKWAKLANSMRLRVAIRISGVYPELAKINAEEAIKHAAGFIESNQENAMMSCGTQTNPYFLSASSWSDLRVNANIVDYMKGYNDPRMASYFNHATFALSGGRKEYIGMRIGEASFEKEKVSDYSTPAYTATSELLVFCAAETAFLRAEGIMRGWNVGTKSAQAYYEDGIRLSMEQYGVQMPADYLTSSDKPEGHSDDPRGTAYNYTLTNTVTAGWGSDDEKNLQRIITQKWIANYPLGLEAWAEFRRTGYPELYPVINNLSPSGVDSKRGMRRLRYPYTEALNNTANYKKAVSYLLGADTEATELGWTKKN